MPLSLAKIDEKLSAKRREMADLIDNRQSAFQNVDALSEKLDALSSDDPQFDAVKAEHNTASKELVSLSDSIRKVESELSALQADRELRVEANRQEAAIGKPQERSSPAVASDPAPAKERVLVLDLTNEQKDHDLASMFRNKFIAKESGMTFAAVCRGDAGEEYRNDRLFASVMGTGSGGGTGQGGAAIVPVNYVRDRVIELLRPRTTVRSRPGVREIPLPNGNINLPRQSGAATAHYVGELENIPISRPATDSIPLAAKKLTIMVPQSGELLRRSSPSSDRLIRDDLIQTLAQKEDSTFLRAAGSSLIPKGLKAFCDATAATQVMEANQTVNLANVTHDLGKLILAVVIADTPMLNPHFILSPRSERFLMDMRDGNGNIAFPEMLQGRLRQYPYAVTTQVPDNLTVSGTTLCSEVYFGDFSELLIGDTPTFDMSVSTEAAYHDGTNVVAAYSQDTVLYRLIVEHDTNIRHPRSFAMLTRVIWGKA
jgi:HK97 family phage major capsid protein